MNTSLQKDCCDSHLTPVPSSDNAPEHGVADITVGGGGEVVLLEPVWVRVGHLVPGPRPLPRPGCRPRLAPQQELYSGALVHGAAVVPGVHAGGGHLGGQATSPGGRGRGVSGRRLQQPPVVLPSVRQVAKLGLQTLNGGQEVGDHVRVVGGHVVIAQGEAGPGQEPGV